MCERDKYRVREIVPVRERVCERERDIGRVTEGYSVCARGRDMEIYSVRERDIGKERYSVCERERKYRVGERYILCVKREI